MDFKFLDALKNPLRYCFGIDYFLNWFLSFNQKSWCFLSLISARNDFLSAVTLAKLDRNTVKTEKSKVFWGMITYEGFGILCHYIISLEILDIEVVLGSSTLSTVSSLFLM